MNKESITPNFEQRENLALTAETLTADELMKIVYQGSGEPQDSRFLNIKDGGAFKYLDLTKLANGKYNQRELYYPVVRINEKIIGLCELEKSPYKSQENTYWITFISIDPDYQGKGYGSKLTEEAFRFAKERGATLQASMYSPDGWSKLKPLQQRLAAQYGVDFIDTEDKTTNFDDKEGKV